MAHPIAQAPRLFSGHARLRALFLLFLMCVGFGPEVYGQTGAARRSDDGDVSARASRRAVDTSLADDARTTEVIASYAAKIRSLEVVIGTLAHELKKTGIGAGTLGNFVTNAMRARASDLLGRGRLVAITNGGGLRRSIITPGELRVRDVYELLPFENALVAIDMSGEQLLKFLQVVLAGHDAQSGAVITYRANNEGQPQLTDARLTGERRAVDPAAAYTVITIDYLVKRGGDYAILQQAKSVRPLNVTLRDAVLDYIKGETTAKRSLKAELDGRFKSEDASAEKIK